MWLKTLARHRLLLRLTLLPAPGLEQDRIDSEYPSGRPCALSAAAFWGFRTSPPWKVTPLRDLSV